MDGPARWACYIGGTASVGLAVIDVFMTVLYARAAKGPVSHRMARHGWEGWRRLARASGRWKDVLLGYFGPLYLVTLIAVWVGLLFLGFTLLTWPGLGSSIRAEHGDTPTDFITAFSFAGGSLTTVGTGDLKTESAFYHILTVLDSVLGICVVTLVVTYVVQIYNALQRRNSLALGLHHASACTGDAAVLLEGFGPDDDFRHGEGVLEQLADAVTVAFESHHFYSVLLYFRFREPHYCMARGATLMLDALSLMESALDEKHAWLGRLSARRQLQFSARRVLEELGRIYLPHGIPGQDVSAQTLAAWRQRYRAAHAYLRAAGISVVDDVDAGAERYLASRRHWDALVVSFAHYLEFELHEIDRALDGAPPRTEHAPGFANSSAVQPT